MGGLPFSPPQRLVDGRSQDSLHGLPYPNDSASNLDFYLPSADGTAFASSTTSTIRGLGVAATPPPHGAIYTTKWTVANVPRRF